MTTTFCSAVALSESVKETLISHLNVVLATTIDLNYQVKQAHWNIKGPQFVARHQLFDKLAAFNSASSDQLAERASTLGGYARGTIRLSVEASELPEYELKATQGREHIAALVQRYAAYTALLRRGIEITREVNDPVTEDLYVEILRQSELDLWFLDNHQRTASSM